MTREEARQIMSTWLVSSKGAKGQLGYIEGWFDEEDAEAFRMAIEALSAEQTEYKLPFYDDVMEMLDKLTLKGGGETARGKWIPLGHQIGFLKHPWSEDYQCSLCGYEAYTIGTPPPSVCPQCHANNTIDKALAHKEEEDA